MMGTLVLIVLFSVWEKVVDYSHLVGLKGNISLVVGLMLFDLEAFTEARPIKLVLADAHDGLASRYVDAGEA